MAHPEPMFHEFVHEDFQMCPNSTFDFSIAWMHCDLALPQFYFIFPLSDDFVVAREEKHVNRRENHCMHREGTREGREPLHAHKVLVKDWNSGKWVRMKLPLALNLIWHLFTIINIWIKLLQQLHENEISFYSIYDVDSLRGPSLEIHQCCISKKSLQLSVLEVFLGFGNEMD